MPLAFDKLKPFLFHRGERKGTAETRRAETRRGFIFYAFIFIPRLLWPPPG